MKILFLVTLLCFVALSWAAFSILRHIRAFRTSESTPKPLPPKSRLASASARLR